MWDEIYVGRENHLISWRSKNFKWLKMESSSYFLIESESEVAQSRLTLCDPMDCTCQAPSSMGFSRQDYWSGLPFPSPGDLANPGMEPRSPALQEPQGGFYFLIGKP